MKTKAFIIMAVCALLAACGGSDPEEEKAVDLGLSVKWASYNVGANSVDELGDYFAWGEVKKSEVFHENYCKAFGVSNERLVEKETIDSINFRLTPEHDAAAVNWKNGWRMPTKEEFKELRDKCNWSWCKKNGYYGYRVVGPNGKSIFLPAAGRYFGTNLEWRDESGYYWAADAHESDCGSAYYIDLMVGQKEITGGRRYLGYSIRAVKD